MALEKTLPSLCGCIEPPLWPGTATDGSNVGVKIDQARGSRGRRSVGHETVDIVLHVRRLLVAVDVVVTGLAKGLGLGNSVNKVDPVEITLPVDIVVKVRPRPGACVSGSKCGHIVTPETEIEIGGVPTRRPGKSIKIICPADAAIDGAMGTDRGGSRACAWRATRGTLIGVAVVTVGALDGRVGAESIGCQLGVQVR